MIRNTELDTIAALATPPGAGALAVVRVSGPEAVALVGKCFRGDRDLTGLAGYTAAHGCITSAEGAVLDEVVAWVYRSPRSFTGEDGVEIGCHGGIVPARRVLERLGEMGARPAGPGEFTRRAFLNGRIDLAQAEAVADVIGARGSRAHELALSQLAGGLSRRVRELSSRVRSALARLEAHIDFGEDVPEAPDAGALRRELAGVREDLGRLVGSQATTRRWREGISLALLGRPNVGKSSLLNALLGYDRALVHEMPGTTRDVVDAQIEWGGVPVRLVDTAGIRREARTVERAGIEQSHREGTQADRILWVLDAGEGLTDLDREVGSRLDAARLHVVWNKIDLVDKPEANEVSEYSPIQTHLVSARTGAGLQDLMGTLLEELGGAPPELDPETVVVVNDRHVNELSRAMSALERADAVLDDRHPAELGAADLQEALRALSAITGESAGHDLLDEIFQRFCIGK